MGFVRSKKEVSAGQFDLAIIGPISEQPACGVPEPSSKGSNISRKMDYGVGAPERKGEECSSSTVQKSSSHCEGATPLPTLETSDVRLHSNAALAARIFCTDGHIQNVSDGEDGCGDKIAKEVNSLGLF